MNDCSLAWLLEKATRQLGFLRQVSTKWHKDILFSIIQGDNFSTVSIALRTRKDHVEDDRGL